MKRFAEIPEIAAWFRAANDVDVKTGGEIRLCVNSFPVSCLEVVSKPQIRFKGKASGRSGKRRIDGYVSI